MPVPDAIEAIEAALAHKTVYEAAVLVSEWLKPLPAAGSTRVRVAVGFNHNGWTAFGESSWTNEGMVEQVSCLGTPRRLVWIEADVPPPAVEPTVVGRVAG